MATEKGQEFISKYKDAGILKETWLVMYRKRHITLEELCECVELTDAEVEQLKNEQIDICPGPSTEERLLATQKMVLSLQEQILDII